MSETNPVHHTPDITRQQEESLIDNAGYDHGEEFYDQVFYGDFVLVPRDSTRHRIQRWKRTQAQYNTATHAAVRSLHIFPEILERICYFVSQAALRQTVSLVCKSWYYAAAPFMRKEGTWMVESQKAEDTLLSRMVTLDTLRFTFCVSSIGLRDRPPPYNQIAPALSRFLKTITDPIEDVLPTLQPLYHPLSSNQGRGRSALYKEAFISAQQARFCGKSCLLDFPTRIEFRNFNFGDSIFQSVLMHLGHIHTLKLIGASSGTIELMQILSQCLNLDTLMIEGRDQWYGSCLMTFDSTVATGNQSQSTPSITVAAKDLRQFPRLVHFSATGPRFTQKTVKNLLKALPSLTYFKVQHANVYNDPSPPLNLPFLYRHASECCHHLEFIQIIQMTAISSDAQQLAMVQQSFPQIRQLSIGPQSRDWVPDLSSCLFFSQLTHLEFVSTTSTSCWFYSTTFDLILRSAPRLISLQAPQLRISMSSADSFEYKCSWYYDEGRKSSAIKRKARLARRITKQLEKNRIRELPHPSQWLCRGLLTADLSILVSHTHLIQYIVRQCPQLVDLTLRMDRLAMGQSGSGRTVNYLFKRKALYAKHTRGVVMKSGGYAVEYRKSEIFCGDEVRMLVGLKRLERLVFHVDNIPGELNMHCFEWMSERTVVAPSGPRRRGNTAIFRESYKYWPRMEQFVVHCPKHCGEKYRSLWRQLAELRPSVEFLLYNR